MNHAAYDPKSRGAVRMPPRELPTGRNVLERADPIVVKTPTVIPPEQEIVQCPKGRAYGIDRIEMRTKGARGTESRLPPPTRKRDKRARIVLRLSQEDKARAIASLKFGK
jgi:hypothetical protein